MTEKKVETATKNPKKVNLLDHHSIKHILDESVSEIVTSRGFVEDVRLSNIKLLLGTIIIVIALFAQFYKKKFPENRDFLIGCIILYIVFNGLLQLIVYTKEKNAILFTYPPVVNSDVLGLLSVLLGLGKGGGLISPNICPTDKATSILGSFTSTGLVVSSKLPRFSDMYTLTIASADPKSISANPSVELTKRVTQWFTKDGVLVEGLFWKDVEALVDDYVREPRKKK